jgi:hypothetical protein
MNRMTQLVIAGAAAAIGAGALAALDFRPLDAKVSFAFHAVDKQMPAGTYRIGISGSAAGATILIKKRGETGLILIPQSPRTARNGNRPRLVFRCVDQECTLSEIWSEGEGWTVPTPRTAAEKERVAVVYLSRASGD